LTDYQIAAKTCELLDLEPSEPLVERLVRRYEELLPASLPRRVGHVLPNVREILEQLHGRDDVRSYLLTGNTRGGATAKLTHYGLIDFFPDGAFAEDTRARATIAQRALALARQAGHVDEQDMFVIGDTPHDVECANAIGVRTIAVATGGYSVEELRAHHPWRVFDALPPPDEFLALVGVTRSASAKATARPARGTERAPA
jgi:phosphoglycolate phosphatase-like HAD superfamily hydrolase